MDNPTSFWREALWQGECAVTHEGGGDWHAHHVVYRQHCRKLRVPEHDPRDVLRVTHEVHSAHHNRKRPIPTKALTDDNLEFAIEAMGAEAGVSYLRRHYDDSDPDPRLEATCPATTHS